MLALAACSGGGGGGGSKGEIEIWSSLPRQGSSKGQTDTIVNAINMALEEKNGTAGGYTIKYSDKDDSTAAAGKWDEATEIKNANDAVADDKLVAYIGTFNSGAAKLSIPILCGKGMVMVSPANTYPGLTKAGKGEADEPDKYYPNGCTRNYFRVVAADDLQGLAGAKWAAKLGAKNVYVLDDTELYGKGIADVFNKEAPGQGLTVLGRDGIDGKATDYKALAEKIKATNPDLVYYGGITQNNAGQLWRDLRDAMPSVKLMGPDGILEDAWIRGRRRGSRRHVHHVRWPAGRQADRQGRGLRRRTTTRSTRTTRPRPTRPTATRRPAPCSRRSRRPRRRTRPTPLRFARQSSRPSRDEGLRGRARQVELQRRKATPR